MRPLLILLFIPVLAAITLDILINFFPDIDLMKPYNINLYKEGFIKFADAGWVFERFAPGPFETIKSMSMDEAAWDKYIVPILSLPMIVVAGFPFLLALLAYGLYVLFANKFFIETFRFNKKTKAKDKTIYKNAKTNALKFKRK